MMELLLVLLLPAIILFGATLVLAKGKTQLPSFLSRAGKNHALYWNIMVGISITVAVIKYASGK